MSDKRATCPIHVGIHVSARDAYWAGYSKHSTCYGCQLARRHVAGHATRAAHSWLDPLVVEFALVGHRLKLSRAERQAAVHALTRRGLTAARIATELGCTQRTVVRLRARQRADA